MGLFGAVPVLPVRVAGVVVVVVVVVCAVVVVVVVVVVTLPCHFPALSPSLLLCVSVVGNSPSDGFKPRKSHEKYSLRDE